VSFFGIRSLAQFVECFELFLTSGRISYLANFTSKGLEGGHTRVVDWNDKLY